MYMQQLLCLVVEGLAAPVQRVDEALREKLDDALRSLGFVHFASVALLPGLELPNRPSQPPALMLELAVDENIAPHEAVRRLVDTATDSLWQLLGLDAALAGPSARKEKLRERLLPLAATARADGGFVGMRDRAAEEVRAELFWFEKARDGLNTLQAENARLGRTPGSPELVCQLLAALASDPLHQAMRVTPARSFWRRPRAGLLQLLLALAWVALPLPLAACLLALLGWLVGAVGGLLPGQTGALVAGVIATAVMLFLVVGGLAAFSKRVIAQAVLLLVASSLGLLLFQSALVLAFLRVDADAVAFWSGPLALAATALTIAVSWLLWHAALRRKAWLTQYGGLVLAVLGALLSSFLVGAAWRATLSPPPLQPLQLLPYVLPAATALVLLLCSVAARWYFTIGLPLTLLLLVAGASSWDWLSAWVQHVWCASEAALYALTGLLALLDMALLAALALLAWALWNLRAPRAPLGLPLLAAALLLLALHLTVGSAMVHGLRVLSPQADPWLHLKDPWTYVCIGVSVALVALLLLLTAVLAQRLLPAVEHAVEQQDAWRGGEAFQPHPLDRSIVGNESELFDQPGHMISLTDVRGPRHGLNALMIWIFLRVVGIGGTLLYPHGWLGSAWGIKFGHWHLVQGGRRLLFVSNYDGDFGGYLDEFIRGTSQGINLIWRWTELKTRPGAAPGQPGVERARGFPPTRWAAFAGCQHEQAFKAYARASMVPHLYLYQRNLQSNEDIERVRRLREALAGPRTPANDELVIRALQA